MSSLTALTRHVARRLGLPTRRVLRAMDVASAQLGRIRYPNALLFGGVLIPVIAFGFSFGGPYGGATLRCGFRTRLRGGFHGLCGQ